MIERLTSDEDLRQDLWVHYLTTGDIKSLPKQLEKLLIETKDVFLDRFWEMTKRDTIDPALSFYLEKLAWRIKHGDKYGAKKKIHR